MLEILKKMNPLYIEPEKKSKPFTPMSDTKSVTIKAEEPNVRKASPFRESITSQFNVFNASKKVRESQSGTLRPKTGVTRNERPTTLKSTSTVSRFDSKRPSNSAAKSRSITPSSK
jgi:hypothetical protein